jgi:galactokinase
MEFQQVFKAAPQVQASAPGRVNLLGEHTDYNEGFVLPTAIPQQTIAAIGWSPDDRHHIYSVELAEKVDINPAATGIPGFASYPYGCIKVLEQAGYAIPPLNLWITSSVPIGAGLSSSAALEIATLRGLRSLLHLPLDDVSLARLGQQAEQQYAGVQCGIMDQMASSLADPKHLLFLDTRHLDYQLLPLPDGAEILVLDSGIPRTLAGSGYNQRRAECEAAARQLGVKALRDVPDIRAIGNLPEPLQRRARHVITENARVLEARQSISARQFGHLMNASHASLRDDYDVSTPELDSLVKCLQEIPQVFGAKLTGAGFGGACVALVAAGEGRAIAQAVLSQYHPSERKGCLLVISSEDRE